MKAVYCSSQRTYHRGRVRSNLAFGDEATFSVDNLDTLETLSGKDWYYYRKNEVDVSTIHRDSFHFFV